jgi:polyisoprenoid-binding protein YceI
MQALDKVRENIGLSIAETPQAATVRYLIDAKKSTFTVKAFATGILSMFGHSPTIAIPDFEGEVTVNPAAVEQSSLRMVLHAASLDVIDDISKKDHDEINRQVHQDVIESDSFPEIVYECSRLSATKTGEGQYSVVLNGDLALHGVTSAQPVSARVWINEQTLRATGDFSVRQSDYEIRPVSAAGGGVRLKDELKLTFDISARRQA